MGHGVKLVCAIAGCGHPSKARGWCRNHYALFLRNGSPSRQTPKAIAFIDAAVASKTDECVLWPYSQSGSGYGRVCINGKMRQAHRICLERVAGNPPSPKHVAAHAPEICHNQLCINPRHLRWATEQENNADKILDRTDNRGERCGSAKLDRTAVLAIRADARTQAAIAAEYRVSPSQISQIKS